MLYFLLNATLIAVRSLTRRFSRGSAMNRGSHSASRTIRPATDANRSNGVPNSYITRHVFLLSCKHDGGSSHDEVGSPLMLLPAISQLDGEEPILTEFLSCACTFYIPLHFLCSKDVTYACNSVSMNSPAGKSLCFSRGEDLAD